MTEAAQQGAVAHDPRIFDDAKGYCLKNPLYTISGLFEHLKSNRARYQYAPNYADAYSAILYLMDTQAIPRRDTVGA